MSSYHSKDVKITYEDTQHYSYGNDDSYFSKREGPTGQYLSSRQHDSSESQSDGYRSYRTGTSQSSGNTSYYDDRDPSASSSQTSTVRPAERVGNNNGHIRSYVRTEHEHGGSPSGGPDYNPSGYYRDEHRGVVVHNYGGALQEGRPIIMGEGYGNPSNHCRECRELSSRSDFLGACFCRTR